MTDALTREELLVILIEECAEVTKAVTKIQRFGWTTYWPHYGVNSDVLAAEIGDLLGIIDALPHARSIAAQFRANKIERVIHARENHNERKRQQGSRRRVRRPRPADQNQPERQEDRQHLDGDQ